MGFKSKKLILFTGAGFTYNFGGYLGSEMWSKIFNNPAIQSKEKIRELLLDNFDFESAYYAVFNESRYDQSERMTLRQAIEEAYKYLDDNIKNWTFNTENPTALNTYGLEDLLNIFSASGLEKNLFFTLNQDLLMERMFQYRSPGVSPFNYPLNKFDNIKFVTLPDEKSVEKAKCEINNFGGLIYIKLHGSYGWLTTDQNSRMVIGKNKIEDINQEPLLRWYFELFQNAIREGDKRMLIVGYGFHDEHINKALIEGVEKHNLSLYVINPSDPYDFRQMFNHGIYYALPLWSAIRGYFPYSLRQIFPPDQKKTTIFDEIKKALLQ